MNTEVTNRPSSVVFGRDPEVLQAMLDFYAAPGAEIFDVTAGARRMWKGVKWDGPIRFLDIDPSTKPDVVGDFRQLPIREKSVDVLVFDPPHLPAAAASPKSLKRFAKSEGLAFAPKENDISSYFVPFLKSAAYVLRQDGLIFAKLSDYVHNHKHRWMLVRFIESVWETPGLTPCDLIVKRDPAAGRLRSGRWVKTHHVRNAHCWWIVVRKGGCEPKKGISNSR